VQAAAATAAIAIAIVVATVARRGAGRDGGIIFF
jgi:hypothetical protein